MDKYIDQLLELMKNFGSNLKKADNNKLNFDNYFEDIENWIEGKRDPFANASEITTDHFPPANMLDDKQAKRLYNGIVIMLQQGGTHISLPLEIPIKDKYRFVRESWPEFDIHENTHGGRFIYDFCTGYAPECVLENYCPCKKILDEEENKNNDESFKDSEEIIDNFYTKEDNSDPPRGEEGEILFDELWKGYKPIKYVTSKYVKQLVQDIENAAKLLHPSGNITILTPHNGEVDAPPSINYKTIFEHLGLFPIDFPPSIDLSVYDADAVSKALMNMFNDDFFNEFLPYQLFDKRYDILVKYLANEMMADTNGKFVMKPMTKEEWDAAAKQHNALLDDVIGDINFKKGEHEDEDFDENELPF